MEGFFIMQVPFSCVPFIKLQRTNYKNIIPEYIADMKNEFESIKDYLPKKKNIIDIIDIGCGVAGIDVLLSKYYGKPFLYLIDKDCTDNDIKYGFSGKPSAYNSNKSITDMMEKNNIGNYFIYNNFKDTNILKESVDLIFSLLACGFHFSIDEYINFIFEKIHHNGVLILDIRKTELIQILTIKKYFSIVKEIKTEHHKTMRIYATGVKRNVG
jgi:hypothetical protein